MTKSGVGGKMSAKVERAKRVFSVLLITINILGGRPEYRSSREKTLEKISASDAGCATLSLDYRMLFKIKTSLR